MMEEMIDLLRSIDARLRRTNALLAIIASGEAQMTQATDNLATAVQRETSVVSSVTTLISGLASQIKQTSADPQVQALADRINANSDTLANAVTANTPAQAGDGSAQSNASG
jgi:cell pole-organizing protein PopZ